MSDRHSPVGPEGAADLIAGRRGEPDVAIGLAEDPNTGEATGRLYATRADAIEEALAAATKAWSEGSGAWSGLPVADRLRRLRQLAAALDARAEEFALCHAVEIGVPMSTARLFAGGVGGVVEDVADTAEALLKPRRLDAPGRRVELLRLPFGPAALMASWNAPAFVAATKLANALAAGCPALFKPSEHAPASTGVLVDALIAAELGPGAAQVVCGGAEVGHQLASDGRVRVVSYTGGVHGGRAIAAAAIGRMASLQLELSASNPAIVVRGADLETAARELAAGMVVLNGQWCEAPRRVFVHHSEHDRLISLLLDRLRERTIGHSLDPATDIGPLAHRPQFERVTSQLGELRERGEAATSHSTLPAGGFFLSPTIVGGLPFAAVSAEIFGPVLAVHPYTDLEAAVDAANGLGDGLAAYVFAADGDSAFALGSRLHAGEVRIGGVRLLDLASGSAQSFWGTSGIGGHGRADVLGAHLGTRVVGEENFDLPL
jgi:betaine-aldehyde dehydrogenase